MFLQHVSIRAKICAAFAVVLCLTSGLGLFAILRLSQVNAVSSLRERVGVRARQALTLDTNREKFLSYPIDKITR